jgi:electron transport complex protein RnfB
VTFDGCAGCGACLLTCPTHAIRPDGGQLYVLDQLCTACGECVEVCPVDAVHLTDTETDSEGNYERPRNGRAHRGLDPG